MTVHASVRAAFDAVAKEYDAERRLLIPCFDGFYGNALAVIGDWGVSAGARVLDLGAGTGLFSAMIAESTLVAAFHLVDISRSMLEEATLRFAGRSAAQVTTEVVDLAHDGIAGSWDLIVSALAIHHLDDEAKRRLYRQVFDALKPGGLFVNAEQVLGPTPVIEERYVRQWYAAIRDAGAGEERIERAVERMEFDQCSTVEDQLCWLREAGFPDVDCTFKAWRFAVIAAWKAPED